MEDLLVRELGLGLDHDEFGVKFRNVSYLDYGGAALAPKTVLKECYEELVANPLCNPHTRGSTLGDFTHNKVESMRKEVLSFVGASETEYMVVFTAGCTAALKLIGEVFPWSSNSMYAYSTNSHNSLMGIRELSPCWTSVEAKSLFGDLKNVENPMELLSKNNKNPFVINKSMRNRFPIENNSQSTTFSLFGIPGECNFTGTKANWGNVYAFLNSLSASSNNHSQNGNNHQWMWILDGAKLFADDPFSLNSIPVELRPDFITLSFYKIFGYPTGIGALILRRDRLQYLQKRYFGGGTLLAGTADSDFLIPKSIRSPDYFEDGTANYQGIVCLGPGFRFIKALGGMSSIQQYCGQKRQYLAQKMQEFYHPLTRKPLCCLYSFSNDVSNNRQGPTIAFNLYFADGNPIPFGLVGELANRANIQLRTGCFCNLGGCQEILQISAEEMEINYYRGRYCSEDRDRAADVLQDKNTGACRISLGYGTTLEDCDKFLNFLRLFLDRLPPAADDSIDDANRNNYHHRLIAEKNENSSIPFIPDAELFWTQKVQYFVPRNVLNGLVTSTCSDIDNHQLAAIFVYPVKSCAGIRVDHWPLLPPCSQGLLYDRIFAITDDSGRVLSQKLHPSLALIRPYFYFHGNSEHVGSTTEYLCSVSISLRLTSPFNDTDLELPLEFPFRPQPTQNIVSSYSIGSTTLENDENEQILRVCGRKVTTRRISSDADDWMSTFFRNSGGNQVVDLPDSQAPVSESRKYHIVKSLDATEGKILSVKSSSGKIKSASVPSSSFANTAQFLLLSTESVRSLVQLIALEDNNSCDKSDGETRSHFVKVENFRPNLVVSSTVAHEEDSWSSVRFPVYSHQNFVVADSIDEESKNAEASFVDMQVTGPCARCTMVDVNGSNGRGECRVFEALDAYRKQRGRGVCFGQFLANDVLAAGTPQQQQFDQLQFLCVGSVIQPIDK